MTRPLSTLSALVLLAACEPGGSKNDSGDALFDDRATGCVPVDTTPVSWTETTTIPALHGEGRVSVTAPGDRGHGLLTAQVSWSAYEGTPAVGFTNAEESLVDQFLTPDDDHQMLLAEAQLRAGDTIELRVGEFMAATTNDAYPLSFSVDFTWQPVADCWEANDTQGSAVDLPRDTPSEAWLLGTHAPTVQEDYTFTEHDDHYRILVPEGATRLIVDIDWPVADGALEALVYSADSEPYFAADYGYSGGEWGGALRLEAEVTPGDWMLNVQYFDGPTFDAWAAKEEDGSQRADVWDTPYTFEARVE